MLVVGKLFGDIPMYTFLTASLFYLAFSLLAARGIKQRMASLGQKISEEPEKKETHTTGTLMLPTNRWRLLLTFILVVDGIAIFMGFFSIYASKVVGASDSSITAMLAVLQLLAFPLTGLLVSMGRHGLRKLLLFCGLAWALAATCVVFFPFVSTLWIGVLIMAGAVGTTQALLRSLYADTVPDTGSIHGFSTYAIVEKGAAFIGPLVGGSLISFVGYKPVLLVAGFMILVGCLSIGKLIKGNVT
jgi:UMF1 family MFS transporter